MFGASALIKITKLKVYSSILKGKTAALETNRVITLML